MIPPNPHTASARMIHPALTLIASVLYLAAGTGLTLRLIHRPDTATLRRVSLAGAGVAAALHAVVVWQTTWQPGGLNLGLFNVASLIGWLMTALLLITTVRRPVENLGILVLPLTAVATLASLALGQPRAVSAPALAGVDIHILLSITAYSILGIAAAQSLLLAVQEYQLRHRHPGGFMRMLPPLQSMEVLLFTMLRIGFVILTLAIASGWLFVEDLFAQHLVHKTVLSLAAWVMFAILLWGRHRYGWRGQTAARWTLGAFLVLALGFFGSKFVLELVLGA